MEFPVRIAKKSFIYILFKNYNILYTIIYFSYTKSLSNSIPHTDRSLIDLNVYSQILIMLNELIKKNKICLHFTEVN